MEDNNIGAQNNQPSQNKQEQPKVIDEANYKFHAPREKGPTVIGRGGDPFFRKIRASKEQLQELMDETQVVQDWVQRETCNNVALSFLESENLKEIYFQIKDGFGEYGKITLMGFKTPAGVEIPRLKIYDAEGEVAEVLTGPMVLDELNKRAMAYKEIGHSYEEIPSDDTIECANEIQDYEGNS